MTKSECVRRACVWCVCVCVCVFVCMRAWRNRSEWCLRCCESESCCGVSVVVRRCVCVSRVSVILGSTLTDWRCAAVVLVDGGWSSWSEWKSCGYVDSGSSSSLSYDMCLCRSRSCDNPTPRHGGRSCHGNAIHVANCTRQFALSQTIDAHMTVLLFTLATQPGHPSAVNTGDGHRHHWGRNGVFCTK